MTKNYQNLLFLFLLSLAACGGSLSDSDNDIVSDPSVGTNMGNPHNKPLGSIKLSMEAIYDLPEIASKERSAEEIEAMKANNPFICTPINDGINTTQRCDMAAGSLNLHISSILYLDCTDITGAHIGCDGEVAAIAESQVAFDASTVSEEKQVVMSINNNVADFPYELTLPSTSMHVGGLQFVTTSWDYILSSHPALMTELHQVPMKICTSAHEILSDEEMITNCSNANASRGDILFDADVDGNYEYLDYSLPDLTYVALPPTEGVIGNSIPIANQKLRYMRSTIDPNPEFINGSFAPILALKNPVEMNSESVLTLKALLFLKDTIGFVDGGAVSFVDGIKKPVCVQALSDTTCQSDADNLNVGTYDYHQDGALIPRFPKGNIVFEEETTDAAE